MPTYRTAGAWGPGKGSNLTPVEVDENFHELRSDLDDVVANPPVANSIETIEAIGYTWQVTLTDGTVLDPLPIPVAQFRWRGEWTPFTLYYALDSFKVTDRGIYSVMVDHTSDAVFDGSAVGGSPPAQLYNLLIEVVSLHLVAEYVGDYTLEAIDADAYLRLSSGSSPAVPITVTVPLDADVTFALGTTVAFEQIDDGGTITVDPAPGVTLNCSPAFLPSTNGQFAVVQIKKVAADEWTIFGNLFPA